MKQRATFLSSASDGFSLSQFNVTKDRIELDSLQGAKEERFTFSLKELPKDLRAVLQQCHELHVRWSAARQYDSTSPLFSRISPGLHVLYSPLKDRTVTSAICPTLRNLFGADLKCGSTNEAFSTPPILSERFASTASRQYHSNLPTLSSFALYLQKEVCHRKDRSCQAHAFMLLSASRFDVDFDAIANALTVTTFWDKTPGGLKWKDTVEKSEHGRVEVGVLNVEDAKEPEELSLGGWLTVVGEDEKPGPTLFSFPSRHHALPSNASTTFTAAFDHPTGLHPTLRLSFSNPAHLTSPDPSCALHTYMTLPSFVFLDRHQFSDTLFLLSHNIVSLKALSGATDLELPDYKVPTWGSAALFQLAPPHPSASKGFDVTIPMHLRYLSPRSGGYTNVSVPWPVVFWACNAEEGAKMSVNPFDRVNLGYDGLFGDRTMFYHVDPASATGTLAESIRVPVLDTQQSGYIGTATLIAMALGFVWIVAMLLRPKNKKTPASSVKATEASDVKVGKAGPAASESKKEE